MDLLSDFVETSPFVAIADDKGTLSAIYFEARVNNLMEIIKVKYHNLDKISR